MNGYVILPEIFGGGIKAFFTGKHPGIQPDLIAGIASVEKNLIYMPIQKHTGRVISLRTFKKPVVADAVITDLKGVLLGVQVADCVPVLLYNKKKTKIGSVHAGWRGTAQGILKKAINHMADESPGDILVAIGPAIRWCCYEVGEDVLEAVGKETGEGEYFMRKKGKNCLDLPSANKFQALSLGIPEKNIWISEECTYCSPEKFHSYRYSMKSLKPSAEGSKKVVTVGRQGGFIGISEADG